MIRLIRLAKNEAKSKNESKVATPKKKKNRWSLVRNDRVTIIIPYKKHFKPICSNHIQILIF